MGGYNHNKTLWQRFWEKVDKREDDDCWNWMAARCPYGYGIFNFNGDNRVAHRVSYEYLVKNIPDGKVLDHLCKNPGCVNPKHLEVVTQKENVHRGSKMIDDNSRKTHCPKGHPYDEQNTILNKNKNGIGRMCRQCKNEYSRRSYKEHYFKGIGYISDKKSMT